MNQKMEYLRNGVRYCLLLILLVLAFATGAHAAQDDYYYPNYDASANGCVDLMNYVKRVTVTVNGVDYTLNQLDQMRQQGTPLTIRLAIPSPSTCCSVCRAALMTRTMPHWWMSPIRPM